MCLFIQHDQCFSQSCSWNINSLKKKKKLAKEGANKDTPDDISLEVPDHFNLQGAKLSTITQAIAYKEIHERITKETRRTTHRNLEEVREDIATQTGTRETNKAIWGLIRHSPIRLKIRQFFYKSIHGTQKIGTYWFHIPTLEERGKCQPCDKDETMNHILIECEQRTRSIIWQKAEEFAEMRYEPADYAGTGRRPGGQVLRCKHHKRPNFWNTVFAPLRYHFGLTYFHFTVTRLPSVSSTSAPSP